MSNACIDASAFVQSECRKGAVIDTTALTLKAQEILPKYALDDVRDHILQEVSRLQSGSAASPFRRAFG